MRIAVIDTISNKVANVIEVSEDSSLVPPEGYAYYFSKSANIGDVFDGNGIHAPNISVLSQITEIENEITQRRLREAIIGYGLQWLQDKDSEIIQLRNQL